MTSRCLAPRPLVRWLPAVLALSLLVAPAAVADEVEQAWEALVAMTGFVPGQAETVVLRQVPGSASAVHVVGRIPAPR